MTGLVLAALLGAGRVLPAAPVAISQAEAENTVKSFYHDLERENLDKMIAHFDQSVRWYESGAKDQSFVAETLAKYCADYPSRSFSFGPVKVTPLARSDAVTVTFDLRSFLRSPARDENVSSRSHVEWDLVKRDGVVKITRFAGTAAAEPTKSP